MATARSEPIPIKNKVKYRDYEEGLSNWQKERQIPLRPLDLNALRGDRKPTREEGDVAVATPLSTPVRASMRQMKSSHGAYQLNEVQEQREKGILKALNIISESLEPPGHYMDRFREYLQARLDTSRNPNSWFASVGRFALGEPFAKVRSFWHYAILMFPLFYNLALLFSLILVTPPLMFFAVGLALFWGKIVYELYRDVMHRDDVLYQSNVPKDLSLAAAVSAGIGLMLKLKAETGEIGASWIAEFWSS